ncbi:MAG: tRNA lysidine(34) synthetase TilS [Pseudomonadota bacterium]
MLLESVRQAIAKHELFSSGTRGLVGFSGGPDSLCLLHALAQLVPELQLGVLAVHVDHGLRSTSAKEAKQAITLGAKFGVEVKVCSLELDRKKAGNLQEQAREARLAALEQEAKKAGCDWIALGHNAQDQAETVLMRVVRGVGLHGLGGMSWRSGQIVRPLLGVSRVEIEQYLDLHSLQPLSDPTNDSDLYFRNRLRRHVLPLLAEENPEIVQALCRLAENCQEEDLALEEIACAAWKKCAIEGSNGIDAGHLRTLPLAIQHRVLALAYEQATGTRRGLQRAHLEAAAQLAANSDGTNCLDLPLVRIERQYSCLQFLPARGRQHEDLSHEPVLQALIPEPGATVELPDGRRLHAEVIGAFEPKSGPVLDPQRVNFPLMVRGTQPGDRISIGPGETKKVAHLLKDDKIPKGSRSQILLVLSGSEVAMVVGLRTAYGFSPEPGKLGLRFLLEEPKKIKNT